MELSPLETKILAHVSRENYRPVKPRVIAKQIDATDEEVRDVRRAVKTLVRAGLVTYGAKHLVRPADRRAPRGIEANQIVGLFQRTAKGFGFVRPLGIGTKNDRSADVFIPPRATLDAASGDEVLVRLSQRRGAFGKLSGEIVEIVRRDTHQFVGTYFEAAGSGMIQIDGTEYRQPVLVGDPGAKNAAPGDKVVIEMVRFPSHVHDGEGVIVEVLGPAGDPGVDTLSIIREYDLPDDFPEDVLDSAREQADKFDESIGAGRVDLTELTVVTIDPVDARDFDDAISLERIENDHWRLGVHIADVSHFVPEKSALDREARNRATSVYLPDQVLPMLPEVISNNLASLQPDRVRYTKTAFLEFTPEGAPVDVELHSAAIRSDHRFAYEEIDEYLADRRPWRDRLEADVFELVGRMHELAMILRRRRLDAGAIELEMDEVKIDLDRQRRVTGAHVAKNTESHQIIEEFMLAANEGVATKIHSRQWPFLRRVHESPDPRKLKALTEFIAELGIKCESLESRFEIKRVLELVAGRPERHAVHYAVLRSFQRAVYSPVEEGHFALAMECYCHFTSPIRRYPDLTIHRLIDVLLADKKPAATFDDLVMLGQHCSDREQRATEAERELTKLKLLQYFAERIGERMEAVVTGVERFGLFAQGLEIPAEGLIRVQSLIDDYYDYDPATHTLSGRRAGSSFRLGDLLEVEVAHVDVDRRELDFRLVEKQAEAKKPARGGKPSGKAKGGKTAGGKTKAKGKKAGKDKGKGKSKSKGMSGGKTKNKQRRR